MSLSGGISSAWTRRRTTSSTTGVATAVAAGNGDVLGRRRECLQLLARARSGRDDDQRHRQHRHEGLVGELRELRRPVRTGRRTSPPPGTRRTRRRTRSAARRWRRRTPLGWRPSTWRRTRRPRRPAVRDALYNATTKGVVDLLQHHQQPPALQPLLGSGGGTAPTAAFSGTPTSGQAPMNVQFTDSSTGSPTSWSWSFGDGGSSTTQSPSHTYTARAPTPSADGNERVRFGPGVKTNYITCRRRQRRRPLRRQWRRQPDANGDANSDPARSRSACARTRSRGTRPPTSRGRAPPGRT